MAKPKSTKRMPMDEEDMRPGKSAKLPIKKGPFKKGKKKK